MYHYCRAPLYRTELLKTSDKMYVDQVDSASDHHHQHQLSKSYHDISINNRLASKKEMSQSYRELPKPSRLFGWADEFDLHGFGGLRHAERSDGVHRSKSFACKDQRSSGFSGHDSELDEAGHPFLSSSHHRQQRHKTKSYKDTKVSHFMDDVEPIEPPQEFAGLDTHIQKKYNAAKQHCLKKQPPPRASTALPSANADNAVYEFEHKIPMQSSILEAQKFKTVIFVSGN